ncbi:DUF2975 domain-containing protein [Flavihumibacter sp. R14]|nr:DUF2975 domain-containing protein [Flavihumibacter soli]
MKTVKVVARILYIISLFAALFYIFTAVYAAFVMVLHNLSGTALFNELESGQFTIDYPFTDTPFLIGSNTSLYLVMLVVIFGGYGLFAVLLGRVLSVFKQDKLFTPTAVRRLQYFYLANFLIPPAILLVNLFFTRDVQDLVIISILHAIIAVFAWFMAAIFKQGLMLQEEQDHTL